MVYIDEKLEKFTNTVMKQAANKRMKILKELEENRQRMLEQKELQFLEDAYISIQRELRNIQKEKGEMISRAMMESKKKLLQKREEIIQQVFDDVEKGLRKFVESPEYYPFLIKTIKESCQVVGEGEIIISLNKRDEILLNRIKKELKLNAQYKIESADIIGGCKVFNKTRNMLLDNSLLTKMQQQRDEFLEISGLTIYS